MRSSSPPPALERARPLLGTVVAVRVHGRAPRAAHRAIDRAFAAMSEIHRLMSFQDSASEVSRLNREAAYAPVAVHPHTFRVLAWAARMAHLSRGLFDVSVGSTLVERGLLLAPATDATPDPSASFRDIELRAGRTVYFRRPLWVDLGGIAKGYAVDRAIATLRACGITRACVNAGGDLRVLGAQPERVALRSAAAPHAALPVVEIGGGALATSGGALASQAPGARASCHVAGRSQQSPDARTTVAVLARACIVADALTKVVLADRAAAVRILRRCRAIAFIHHPENPGAGWSSIGVLQ